MQLGEEEEEEGVIGEEIHELIRRLDSEGMALLEQRDTAGWGEYLARTRNTVCGRHPIAVLMHAMDACDGGGGGGGSGGGSGGVGGGGASLGQAPLTLRFVAYAQSVRATRPEDSSVSYASALITCTS